MDHKKTSGIFKDIKRTISMLSTVHRPDGSPNIFLFSTPRSGSTWLMELIYTQPGFQWCREPFNIRKPAERKHLQMDAWADLYSTASQERIKRYIGGIASGKLRDKEFNYPRPLSRHYRLVTRRTIFKILHAGEDRINWFRDTFNGQIVFLIRHPIPVSLSRNVYPRLEAFVGSDYQRHFTAKQLAIARRLIADGTDFERGILDWCLQNSLPLRQATPDWVIVTYEQLLLDPERVIEYTAARLDLPYPERMMENLARPSGSTVKSDKSTQAILNQARNDDVNLQLVEKWRKRASIKDEKRAMELLGIFDIDAYQTGDLLPAQPLWIGTRKKPSLLEAVSN